MAWTSPRTWVAGAVVTAAQLNAHLRDNLAALLPLDQVAWSTYTPTLTQSATVSKTVTKGKWTQIGKTVHVALILDPTSSGTANNAITVGLPTTAVSGNTAIGAGWLFENTAGANYPFIAGQASTTTFTLVDAATPVGVKLGQTGASMATAIGTGDQIVAHLTYEAA